MKKELTDKERTKILDAVFSAQPVDNRYCLDETLTAIGQASAEWIDRIDSAKLKKIAECDAEWVSAANRIADYGRDKVRPALADQAARLAKDPNGTALSREGMTQEFETRRAAFKVAARKASALAVPIAVGISEAFLVHCRAEVEKVVLADFKTHEKFGVPYQPSELVKALKSAERRVERTLAKLKDPPVEGSMGGRPRDMIAAYGISL